MTEVAFALLVGFILGLLVGFLMRGESRQFKADVGGHEEAQH